MEQDLATLADCSRSERSALCDLLVAATAAAGRDDLSLDLDALVRAAPVDVLPAAAALHRVPGTVAAGLDGVDALPDDIRHELIEQRADAAMHHLLLVGALGEVANAFDEAGLRWLVMKGPVLAARLYANGGDRSYADIDLLVHPGDFGAAIEALEGLDYHHQIHDWARAHAVMAGQVGLLSDMLDIDLHWHLHYSEEDRRPFRIDPVAMLDRRERVEVAGLAAPVLDPVDRLLMLTFHAARSGGHRLLWLKDIERSLSVEAPDAGEIARRSRAAALAPIVGLMLDRARRVLHAPVDDALVGDLLPTPLRLAEAAAQRLTGPAQLDDDDTAVRMLSRSTRPTFIGSVTEVPARAVRHLKERRLRYDNETDDPGEKASYLAAVAATAS